jgi:peptidyl-prolyl cis-trans isomerase A (cyclophilin A)
MTVFALSWVLACGAGAEITAERDALKGQVVSLENRIERLELEKTALDARVQKLQSAGGGSDRQGATDARRKAMTELDAMGPDGLLSRMDLKGGDKLGVTLETSLGTITCDLYPDKAPLTVLNFYELATGKREWKDPRSGEWGARPLYDGTIFHRVIPKFMIQGGDPQGTGRGGPGYRFKDEKQTGVAFSEPGLLAMANAGPNSNGSQFFITDGTPTHLNGRHTIFGGGCEPMEVVKAIALAKADRRNKPLIDVTLEKVTFQRP